MKLLISAFLIFMIGFQNKTPINMNTQHHPIINTGNHSGRLEGLFAIPEKQQIISVGEEGTIRVLNAKTGEIIQIYALPQTTDSVNIIYASAISPDKQTLAIGGHLGNEKKEIWIINLTTWNVLHQLDGHAEGVKALAFSQEGGWLVSGGYLGDIKVWTTKSYKSITLKEKHDDFVIDLAVAKNADFFVSAGRDGVLMLWIKQNDGRYSTKKLAGHSGIPLSVDVALDDSFFVSAGLGGNLLGWDKEGNKLWSNQSFLSTTFPLGAVAISPNGQYVSFKEDGRKGFFNTELNLKTHILDVRNQELVYTHEKHQNTVLETVFYGNDEVVTGSGGSVTIMFHDYKNQQILQKWQSNSKIVKTATLGEDMTLNLLFSPYMGYGSDTGKSFSFKTNKLSAKPIASTEASKKKQYQGKKLSKINANAIQIVGGKTIEFDDKIEGRVQDFFFVGEGNIVVLGDYALNYYDNDGKLIRVFKQDSGELRAVDVSNDGKYLITVAANQVTKLFNLNTDELLVSFFSHDDEWVLLSPAGYYNSSEKTTKLITWFSDKEYSLLAAVDINSDIIDKYYQPDLIQKIIHFGSLEQALNADSDQTFPSVRFPKIASSTKHPDFTLDFTIEALNQIHQAELYLNKALIHTYEEFGDSDLEVIKKLIHLNAGDNLITVKVTDKLNHVTSENLSIFFDNTPEVVLSSGHTDGITSLTISPNGQFFASSSLDNTLKIWDINSSDLYQTLEVLSTEDKQISGIRGAAFHPTDTRKICAISGKKIFLFDFKNREILREFYKLVPSFNLVFVNSVAFSKDGEFIIAVYSDGYLRLWATQTGELTHESKIHDDSATAMCLGQNGQYFFTVGTDNRLHVFDYENLKLVKSISLSGKYTNKDTFGVTDFIAVSSDGQTVAVGGILKDRIEVIDIEKGAKRFDIHIKDLNRNKFSGVAFSKQNQHIVVSSFSKPIKVYNSKTGEEIKNLPKEYDSTQAIASNSDQTILISSHGIGSDFSIKTRALPDGQLLADFGNDATGLTSMDISKSGRFLAASGVNKTAWVWDLATLQVKSKVPVGKNSMKFLGAYDISFNAKSNLIAVASCDDSLRIIDINQDRTILAKKFSTAVRAIDFHPTKDNIVIASEGVKIWNLKEDKISTLGQHQGSISQLTFSPNGQFIACISEAEMSIWDVEKQSKTVSFPFDSKYRGSAPQTSSAMVGNITGANIFAIAFSPNGQFVTFGDDLSGRIHKYDLIANQFELIQEKTLLPDKYISMAISPDNRFLAASKLHDYSIELFDIERKKLVRTIGKHDGGIRKLIFNTKSNHLYSCSKDGTVRMWDWEKSEEVVSLISSGEGNYFFKTNDNHYYNNREGQTNVNFSIGNQRWPFEQFDLQLNRPDKVLEQLGQAEQAQIRFYKNAYQKRLEKLEIKEENLAINFSKIPSIEVQQSAQNFTSERNYPFEVTIDGKGVTIKQLNLFVNDVPVYGRNGIDYASQNRSTIHQEISVMLSNGRNKIQVAALNADGVSSLKETFYINCTGVEQKPTLHIIAIGVNKYDNGDDLRYPEKDAKDIVALFQTQTNHYQEIKTHLLLGSDFEVQKLRDLKQSLLQTKVDDKVIVFYAGHGLLDKSYNLFLAHQTMSFKNPAANGVSIDELDNLLDGIPARQKLLLLDACHTGEVDIDIPSSAQENPAEDTEGTTFRGKGKKMRSALSHQSTFDLMKMLFVDLRRGTGATVISSAGGSELARESDQWDNSVFVYCLLAGLKDGKANSTLNGDSKIMVSELQQYLTKEVANQTDNEQRPNMRVANISNDFQIW